MQMLYAKIRFPFIVIYVFPLTKDIQRGGNNTEPAGGWIPGEAVFSPLCVL